MPRLTIVIVSYNTKNFLKNCLSSIYLNTRIRKKVIVVDNHSNDKTSDMVRKFFPQVKLISNRQNLFYSKGNNQGLKSIRSEYFLILNPDITISKNSIEKIIKFMDTHKNCGLSTCREIDLTGKTIRTSHKFHTPLIQIMELPLFNWLLKDSKPLQNHHYYNWDRTTTKKVESIPGSFIFGRTSILEKITGFDENLPLFFSDADFSLRSYFAGYDTYHLGQIKVTHNKASSFRKMSYYQTLKLAYKDMNYYYKKHFGNQVSTVINVFTKISLLLLEINSKLKRGFQFFFDAKIIIS